ncbi:hypothetical protein ABIB25_004368 [Nakamurella sp. UYEF19]
MTERSSYGTPGFRVQDKLFARVHEEPGVLVLWRPSVRDRDELIAAAPDRFFTTPHYDGHPTVLLRLPAVDVVELRELLIDAWDVRAPVRLRQQRPEV